jgi:hypothetical protein
MEFAFLMQFAMIRGLAQGVHSVSIFYQGGVTAALKCSIVYPVMSTTLVNV